MRKHLTKILTILILTSCQTNNVKQEQKLTDIQKSDCHLTNSKTYNIDKIIQGQKEELENENIKENFNTLLDQKIQFLNLRRELGKNLFPYSKVDSVVYVAYHQYDDKKMNFELNDRQPKFATILCSEKIKAVIDLVNDPNNFGYGECGTQISEAHILFFNKGKQVAEILFACSHGQIKCEPENILTNFGGLNEIGNKRLDEIAPWR
jgi:hypothetical protein